MTLGRRLALALTISGSLALGACGGEVVQQPDIETEMVVSLEKAIGVEVVAVNCPADTPVEAEEEFECEADIDGGESMTVTAQVSDPEAADVEITGVS